MCFTNTATTEIYALSLHDALPISRHRPVRRRVGLRGGQHRDRTGLEDPERPPGPRPLDVLPRAEVGLDPPAQDRKSTRLNPSHANISDAAFCLKKTIVALVYVTSQ